jgi:hypothetical protein
MRADSKEPGGPALQPGDHDHPDSVRSEVRPGSMLWLWPAYCLGGLRGLCPDLLTPGQRPRGVPVNDRDSPRFTAVHRPIGGLGVGLGPASASRTRETTAEMKPSSQLRRYALGLRVQSGTSVMASPCHIWMSRDVYSTSMRSRSDPKPNRCIRVPAR